MAEARLIVKLNDNRCIGCGLCEENSPDVFGMGDVIAYVRVQIIPSDAAETVETAARDCPVNAISILPESGRFPEDHNQERKNEEYRGEIREYQRKQRHAGDRDRVETHDSERLKRAEHDFAIVSNDADDDEHPSGVSGT